MEFFDIYDSKGNFLNKKKPREEVHRDGDWHKAVDIWVINPKGELIIQKRASTKESYPNLWEISASGHLLAGEESLPAAIRELEEELGLIVPPKDFEFLFEAKTIHITNNDTFINKEFKEVFLIKRDLKLNELTIQLEELSEVQFIHFTNLEKQLQEEPRKFVTHEEEYEKLFPILYERYG